jgi:hypothetical protein
MRYEGNSSGEDRRSGIASHKKILLKTPCPGRNLPQDTCCFGLSGVTGLGWHLGQQQFHPGRNYARDEETLIEES